MIDQSLTARQSQIAHMMADGKDAEEIAAFLEVDVKFVRRSMQAVRERTQTADTTGLRAYLSSKEHRRLWR